MIQRKYTGNSIASAENKHHVEYFIRISIASAEISTLQNIFLQTKSTKTQKKKMPGVAT